MWKAWPCLVVAAVLGACSQPAAPGDASDTKQVVLGKQVYADHCAACHGANLEGQPNWAVRLPSGRLPAPPHDESGHTWHHPDDDLFAVTKNGVMKTAPPGYESDMPAFASVLSDSEIWAIFAYIKSTWPKAIQQRQAALTKKVREAR